MMSPDVDGFSLSTSIHFNMYVLEQIQHKVPEEALKHEKYTSQLQMSLKTAVSSRPEHVKEQPHQVDSTSGKQEKADKKAPPSEPSIYRTPLYGQPSWWGDDEDNDMHEQHEGRRPEDPYSDRPKELSQHEEEMNDSLGYRDPTDQSLYSFRREPSYFEIPTKDFQQPAKSPETQVHEIPTKDTDTITPPVMQSHASFTIEFDDCRPGRIKIKDHVTKFSMRQRRAGGKENAPNEMISAENKVADWLVQNDPSLIRRPSPREDVYSTKSDLPIHNRILKGNRHEDGTQSDSEDPPGPVPEKENVQSDQIKLQRQIKREPEELLHNQQAFVIEFFDDDAPRKKRSQSFTHSANSSQNESDPANKGKNDKRKGVLAAEKLTTNGTTTAPVVPKPLVNSSFPQRSNSFRREKTEDRISTAGPVTAKPPVKSFGSIGKKSKLAQEFVAEYLREQAEVLKDSVEKPMTLALSSVVMPPASQQVQSSIMGPSAPRCVTPPLECIPMRVKKAEEEDSLSDAGTYTIETENQDKEVEEARNMIDQVFGLFEPEEYSKISSSIYRPVIKLEKEETSLNENIMNHKAAILSTSHPVKMNSEPLDDVQAGKSSGSSRGGQKWVSRWASLADSYPDASPTSPLDGQKSGLLANDDYDHLENTGEADLTFPSRTRRLLPQLPPNDKSESPTPAILVCTESYSEIPQKNLIIENEVKTMPSDPNGLLLRQEDLDPDSLSDASKSDDGALSSKKSDQLPTVSTSKWRREDTGSKEQSVQRPNKLSNEPKSTSFYVGNDREIESLSHVNSILPNVEIPKSYKGHDIQVKPKGNQQTVQETLIIAKIDHQLLKKENGQSRDSFVRQESFTKEKSSCNISPNKLPNISTHPLLKDMNVTKSNTDYSRETQLILKETENALAALEAKLFSQNHIDDIENTPCPPDDSLSGDSDVDTASTVSLVSDKNVPSHPQKSRVVGLHKDKSSSTSSIQDHYNQPSARERLSEKRRAGPADGSSRRDVAKKFEMKRSSGTRGSLDFTDEERSTSLPYISVPDTVSSDYENSSSRNLSRRRPFAQSTKEDTSRISLNAQKVQQALTRSNSLSTPRPTRASKLRRARLGEASDNESADAERVNISSEASSSAKSSSESKKLSRLDILAMPRKRTGSFNVPSDSEASSTRTGFSGRSSDHSYTSRKPAMAEVKQPIKKQVAPTTKQPLTRARSGSVKYSSSSSTQTPRTHNGSVRQRQSALPDGDDDDDQEVYNNFMAQSEEIAEIARLSQTLVNDVASLAKEIHDVAGDGDSQSSSGTGHSTSISSIPNTPASIISAREEILKRTSQRPYPSQLVHHIPEASLNYQKVPPGSIGLKDFDQNMNDNRDDDPIKRRARNREEVIFDNLMLNPVSQLSQTICFNTEVLTEKMKVLFLNKEKSWEEIEAKINSENEVPILKTSNKEISSILKVLRRVQKQLEVINAIIDPNGHLEVIPNKKTSPVIQTLTPQVRTHNSVSKTESHQPVRIRNYIHKSSSGSSRSPESSFGRDEEDAYIV
ncbi:centrosomal protein of 170 kDa protein B isoform X2 [Phyllobates terribilis]|uniref:centrosomal protein of 170 kDa protein B isoform X2 n=1 Tax=Phyllobates terribilis TaxID=111132 RepID=UPI003CCA94EF